MYGQTTSGKTYTMLGEKQSPGILPCAVRDLFSGLDQQSDFKISISYMEIYNEQINDLFYKESANLKLINEEHGVGVQGLKKQ